MEGVNHIKLYPLPHRDVMRGHMTHLKIVSLQFLDFITLDSSLIAVLEFSLYGTKVGLLRRSLSVWTVWVMSGPVNGTEQTQNRIGRRRLNTRRPRSDRKSIGLSVLCRNTVRFVWNAQKRDFINSIIKLRQILFRVAISSYLLVIRIENRCVNNSFLVVDLDKLCNTVST